VTANPYGYYVQPADGARTFAAVLDAQGRRITASHYAADGESAEAATARAETDLAALLQRESATKAAYLEPGDLVEFAGRVEIVREVRAIRGGVEPYVFYDMPPAAERTPPKTARTLAARRKFFREQPPQLSRFNCASYLDAVGFERVAARQEAAA
jgi:hypothetical protein